MMKTSLILAITLGALALMPFDVATSPAHAQSATKATFVFKKYGFALYLPQKPQTESPTAEAAFAALQQLPDTELARLQQMLTKPKIDYGENYQSDWTEEDLADAARATALLIEKRFGPEAGNTN